MEIEQKVNKRKKITRLLLILLMILLSLVCIKYLISKSNKYISENGKSSMGAVVEQIQQTYDLQVSGYYSQLQLVEEFLLHERELSLETDTNKNFFEAWEKNRKVLLYSFRKMVRQYQQVEQKCGLICQVNFCWT
ncbi:MULTISPECIES: hypothetical protein [unclassified Blautia]|uniref:hypothetical protein n=1 Tax=unclassified Blautia TaxID=2648079 RepID=UPI001FAAA19F|nr:MULTISPECIES: hypothetical protein [unclassified Blautia]